MLTRGARFSFIVLCGLPFSAMAQSACQSSYPNVTLRTVFAPTKYDFTQSKENFEGNRVGDMATSAIIKFSWESLKSPTCITLRTLNITLEVSAKIRVSAAYKQGTCEFNSVKAHETKHLQVMQNFFSNLEPYKARIIQQLIGNTAVPATDKEQLDNRLREMVGQMKQALGERHDELQYQYVDDPALVKVEQAKCKNW